MWIQNVPLFSKQLNIYRSIHSSPSIHLYLKKKHFISIGRVFIINRTHFKLGLYFVLIDGFKNNKIAWLIWIRVTNLTYIAQKYRFYATIFLYIIYLPWINETAGNIEQVLEAAPNKAVAVQPLTINHENYPN